MLTVMPLNDFMYIFKTLKAFDPSSFNLCPPTSVIHLLKLKLFSPCFTLRLLLSVGHMCVKICKMSLTLEIF